ncbi:MAG: SCP2 sterol-binding domain-containing protein [Candidatus Helarchaeota archaeon]|nr:SCP2 sterol-binding domain-containing protein [Candidatus Helarchaeota archaeon]
MGLREEIKKKIEEKSIGAEDLPKLFKLAEELCETDEDVQEAAEDAEDTTIQMTIEREGEADLNAYITVKDGKITGGEGKEEDADITITVTTAAAGALAKRDRTALLEAFQQGSIKVEPMDIGRLQSLRAIIDAIREALEVEED